MHDPWLDLPALPERPLTVEDLEPLPDDGRRYELADRRLEVFYASTTMHSVAATRLGLHLRSPRSMVKSSSKRSSPSL
jgi:hypothetical protein